MLDHICRGRSHILFHHRDILLILFYKQHLKYLTYQMLHYRVFVNQFCFLLKIQQLQKLVMILHYRLIQISNCYWC